jgi:hypothetical protein
MRQPDANTTDRNVRPVLAPTRGPLSEAVRGLAPGLREEPCRRTDRGIRWQADTDSAPGGERAGRRIQRDRNIGTRLHDGDWDIGVILTDLPSRVERNPVRTKADPEQGVALSYARPRLPASAAPGAAGGGRCRQAQAAQDEEPLVPSGRSSPLSPWTSASYRVLTVPRATAETLRCRSGAKRGGEPVLGPLLRGGRTVPEDASALEVCGEC